MKIANKTEQLEILLYDPIWPFDAKPFAEALQRAPAKPLLLRINSPGGDVFAGVAIANAVRAHKAATRAIVDGVAASIASYVAISAGKLEMAAETFLMVHRAIAFVDGRSEDLRTAAELLDKVDAQLVEAYRKKSGADEETVRAWLDAETWFSAAEAVDNKLADSMAEHVAAIAASHLARFKRLPEPLAELRARSDPNAERRLRLTQARAQSA